MVDDGDNRCDGGGETEKLWESDQDHSLDTQLMHMYSHVIHPTT